MPGQGLSGFTGCPSAQRSSPRPPCHTKVSAPSFVSFSDSHRGHGTSGDKRRFVSDPSTSPVTLVSRATQRYLRETNQAHSDCPRSLPDRPRPRRRSTLLHCVSCTVLGQWLSSFPGHASNGLRPLSGTVLPGLWLALACHSTSVLSAGLRTHSGAACMQQARACSKAGPPWAALAEVHTDI